MQPLLILLLKKINDLNVHVHADKSSVSVNQSTTKNVICYRYCSDTSMVKPAAYRVHGVV
jgi:hypothetical protein